jgi:hypothetical protein
VQLKQPHWVIIKIKKLMAKRYLRWFYVLLCTGMASCGEKMDEDEVTQIGINQCQRQPQFLAGTGFNTKRSALSTSEGRIKGLVLVQLPEKPGDTVGRKTWQHPSWKNFGWMGPITTDEQGNAFTAPIPVINILDNPPGKQNIVYKVDSKTAVMAPLTDLPGADSAAKENVYGLLGLYYDCHAQKLYASSVAGSSRDKEKGIIYLVDPTDGKVLDKLPGIDAMGLCTGGVTGTKRLYFGSSRVPAVYSVELTKAGNFKGGVQKEFSLDMLGPRGDDKARRIRFDKNGDMLIFGVEFNYNLTAPTERQEAQYRVRYDEEEKKWRQVL